MPYFSPAVATSSQSAWPSVAVGQEQFITALTTPAGLANHHCDAVELNFAMVEEAEGLDKFGAEEIAGEVGGLRALYRKR